MRFLIKSGKHKGPDSSGPVLIAGDKVDSDIDLALRFPLRYERIADSSNGKLKAEPQSQRIDVTESFEDAEEAKLTVERGGSHYYVMDGDIQLNAKPLRKAGVSDFIEDRLMEADIKE